MLFKVYLVVSGREIPLNIYFKKEETYDMWVKHHYLLIAEMIDAFEHTKDFHIFNKRVE
jgi:hypothetical protein